MEHLGFVFQDFNLLDNFTLGENIGLALSLRGERAESVSAKVKEAADQLGIGDILDKMPAEVSGGQRQRCACARAVINHPSLLLADEPTGALDSHSAQLLLECFQYLNREQGATILMVTHDSFSASYCSRILFLRDGKIFSEIVGTIDPKLAADETSVPFQQFNEIFNEEMDPMVVNGSATAQQVVDNCQTRMTEILNEQ